MDSSDSSQKFCIIGAGPSGLAAAKNFQQRQIPFDCFEREDDVGGAWYFGKPNSSIYASTHMISSKRMTEYTDFPMPREFPPFPSHAQALSYLRAYAKHFRLYDRITFKSSVERVEHAGEKWRVTLRDESTPRLYRGVVIANGHHWDPIQPQFPGVFTGQILHSRDYKTPDILRGKRVLVVGAGNSGCDLAVEAAQHAASTCLSLRRGYHFLPKFLFGRPVDSGGERLHRWRVPLWLQRRLTTWLTKIAIGRPENYGLPKPDHQLFETHPIINSQLLYFVGHGRIRVKPNVEILCGDEVQFADGSREPFDLIIYATGFNVSFPFLESNLLCDERGKLNLFLNIFPPRLENLFVVGLIQPNSGLWGLADYQSQLIAAFLLAEEGGTRAASWFRRLRDETHLDSRGGISFIDSPRHAIEVEYFAYRSHLLRLLAKFGSA